MHDSKLIEIQTFEPLVDAEEAGARAERITAGAFLRNRFVDFLGYEKTATTHRLYYPNYLVFTTVELRRYVASDEEVKFLAGVDGITGRVGEIDAELPDRVATKVDTSDALRPEIGEEDAKSAWRDWLFTFLDRKYRPFKRPNTTLDALELFYVPYWIVDYGSKDECYAVSGITKQAEYIEDVPELANFYRRVPAERSEKSPVDCADP